MSPILYVGGMEATLEVQNFEIHSISAFTEFMYYVNVVFMLLTLLI